MKKIIAFLLAVFMITCLGTMVAFADETSTTPITVVSGSDKLELKLLTKTKDAGYHFSAEINEDGENLMKDFDVVKAEDLAGYLIDGEGRTVGAFFVGEKGSYDPTGFNDSQAGFNTFAVEVSYNNKIYTVTLFSAKADTALTGLASESTAAPEAGQPADDYEKTDGQTTGDVVVAPTTDGTASSATQSATQNATIASSEAASKGATGDSADKLSSEVATAAGAPVATYVVIGAAVILAIVGVVVYKRRTTRI